MAEVKTEYVGGKVEVGPKDYRWYVKEDQAQHQSIFTVVERIDKTQSYRSSMNVKHARLYNNLELLGLSVYATGAVGTLTQHDLSNGRITYNLVKSCVDTAASKIAKSKPKPQFLTSGGDYALQARAKKLTQYVEGVFYNCKYYEIAAKVFVDGCVFGTGAMKFYTQDGQIQCERVIPEEIKVDDNDAIYGKPKSLYQVKQLSREVLIDMYPDFAYQINSASSSTPASSNVDLIKVVEAWHLGPHGRHTLCIENATLFTEKWEKDYFPFVFYKWSDRLTGFFGQGLAEELIGTQIEINRTLRNIHLAQKLVAIPRVAIESNSKVSVAQLTNEVGSIIRYQGGTRPPIFDTPAGMNAEVYNHLKWLIQSGYEKTGISQLSATSKKPSGLDSAVALREYSDIETERFMLTAMKYEQMALEASKIVVDLSRDLFTEDPKLSVKTPGKDFIDTIAWKEVNLPEEQYVMKVFPVGLLPSQPAGRLAKVQELIQAGWIDREKALELLDFPDLKAWESLETANNNLVEKNIAAMLENGKYLPPEPQMNLEFAANTAHKHYLKGRVEGISDDKLELLLRFIDDADRLNQLKNPQPVAEAAPAVAQAVPEPLPQSELLPNSEPLV